MKFKKTYKCVCGKMLGESEVDMPKIYPISIVNRQLNKRLKKHFKNLMELNQLSAWTWHFKHEKIPEKIISITIYLCNECFMEVSSELKPGVSQQEIFLKLNKRSDEVNLNKEEDSS